MKQNTVSAMLALNRLPERIRQEYPTSDKVSKSLLIELAAVTDPSEQLRLWDAVKDGGLTVRGVRAARGAETPPTARRKPAVDPLAGVLAEAERLLGRLERLPAEGVLGPSDALERLHTLHRAIGRQLEKLAGRVRRAKR
jgi:hypothetical protein